MRTKTLRASSNHIQIIQLNENKCFTYNWYLLCIECEKLSLKQVIVEKHALFSVFNVPLFFLENVLLVALHNNPFTLHTNKEVKFSTHLFDFLKSDIYLLFQKP